MKYCAGVVDALFGKKIMLELPPADGVVRKVKVTERWLSSIERQCKTCVTEGSIVIAYFIDPDQLARIVSGSVGVPVVWFARMWTIGRDLTLQEYERWRDPETGGLYSYLKGQNGVSHVLFVERRRWQALQSMLQLF